MLSASLLAAFHSHVKLTDGLTITSQAVIGPSKPTGFKRV